MLALFGRLSFFDGETSIIKKGRRKEMINVVIGIIVKQNKILLIKRERGDFVGLWGLPGGKIEECEHIDTAIEREINEELGLQLKFRKLLGTATEIMHDKNSTSILYCCELLMETEQEIIDPEFEYKWFSKEELMKSNLIIESDKMMIHQFYHQKEKNYLKLDCYREKEGKYFWK